MTRRLLLLSLLFCAALLPAATQAPEERLARSVTIIRDTWGVPHVYARTDAGVVFGLMYAQAEDNFWQVEENYIRALGRAAEVYGERELVSDLLMRAFEVERLAKEEYQRSSPDIRRICDAYAAGLNWYLARNPQVRPRLLERFEPWFIFAAERGDGPRSARGASRDVEAIRRAFPEITAAGAAPTAFNLQPLPAPDPEEGSNMWAVRPARSASGRALLFINPHMTFFGGSQRYEAHLHSRERLRVSGFAIIGTPYIRSGHNERLGWSHTNNYADIADAWMEKFDDPARPLAYRYGDGYRTATEWTAEVRVKTDAGMQSRRFRFRKTHHGPIVAVLGNQAVAARTAAFEEGGEMEQRLAMARARNLREFQAALARRRITGSNTIYADRDGNIFYLHGNAIPRRSPKFDWAKPVDGSNPETEWQGYHELSELPQFLNPPSGFLQNCNSAAVLAASDTPAVADFLAYMVPEKDNPRAQMSRRILQAKPKFTFDEWARAALDTRVLLAETQVPALMEEYERFSTAEPQRAARLADAIAELKKWDRVSRNDSVGMTLYMAAREAPPAAGAFPVVAALEKAVEALQNAHGTWRVPWGEVNRLQRVHTSGTLENFSDARPSLPVPGAPGDVGLVFAFRNRAAEGQKRRYGVSGDSYVAVVEFAPRIRTRSLLVFGQSADPSSPHYFDQAPLYSEQRFKPAWFYPDEVKKSAERTYHPGLQKSK